MRLGSLVLAALVFASLATGCGGRGRIITSHGVRVVVPSGWQRVHVARPGPVSDPRTLLVVGTAGVRPQAFHCEIAAYHLPPSGAVVVVVGWKSIASAGGGPWKRGRGPLKSLIAVHRPSFECFTGRGAASTVLLDETPYQVNVMVGDRASKTRVKEALAIARSFDLAR
ncbi:MAG: hypothetical protein E6G22_11800 [Actinobacteria bacterium]|nr:MAG: hypothetical protein E6G22_11800 [Actinomycetota bacterium]